MKRKQLYKQPGFGDFKNKCSERIQKYDNRIIRTIFESIQENMHSDASLAGSTKRDSLTKIEIVFKKQKISILHLEPIISEILTYFRMFSALTEPGKRKQI